MAAMKDMKWDMFDDWCELFGTDIAIGKRSKAFGEGCAKILCADRLHGATSKELEEGYELPTQNIEEGAVDQPSSVAIPHTGHM